MTKLIIPSVDNWQCSINFTPQENKDPQWGQAIVFSWVCRRICSRIRDGLSGRWVQPSNIDLFELKGKNV
jgi:hypothetical protein